MILVPLIESELFFLTGTFLNNYDVRERKPIFLVIGSTRGKREKWEENNIAKTTVHYFSISDASILLLTAHTQ